MFISRELRPPPCEIEIATIMIQSNNIHIFQILPSPVVAGQFAEMMIFYRDIIPFSIWLVAQYGLMEGSPSLDGQEIRMLWKYNLFVGTYKYLDVAHILSVLSMNEIIILSVNFQNIKYHFPDQNRNGEYFAKHRVLAQLSGGRNIKRYTDK